MISTRAVAATLLSLTLLPISAHSQGTASTAPTAATSAVTDWEIDPVHSELTFRIRHLLGRVSGTFTDWTGTVRVDPDNLSGGSVSVTVQMASINTLNEQRDAHLRTPDFFAVDSFPTMTFTSTSVQEDAGRLLIDGNLTIRGHSMPVTLKGTYNGRAPDPWGGDRIAFIASTTVDRNDFGVSFNQVVEGLSMIGDLVDISIAIEAVRQ